MLPILINCSPLSTSCADALALFVFNNQKLGVFGFVGSVVFFKYLSLKNILN